MILRLLFRNHASFMRQKRASAKETSTANKMAETNAMPVINRWGKRLVLARHEKLLQIFSYVFNVAIDHYLEFLRYLLFANHTVIVEGTGYLLALDKFMGFKQHGLIFVVSIFKNRMIRRKGKTVGYSGKIVGKSEKWGIFLFWRF